MNTISSSNKFGNKILKEYPWVYTKNVFEISAKCLHAIVATRFLEKSNEKYLLYDWFSVNNETYTLTNQYIVNEMIGMKI